MKKGVQEEPDNSKHYEEYHINHAEVVCPHAAKVENNHTHTVTVQFNLNFSINFPPDS